MGDMSAHWYSQADWLIGMHIDSTIEPGACWRILWDFFSFLGTDSFWRPSVLRKKYLLLYRLRGSRHKNVRQFKWLKFGLKLPQRHWQENRSTELSPSEGNNRGKIHEKRVCRHSCKYVCGCIIFCFAVGWETTSDCFLVDRIRPDF